LIKRVRDGVTYYVFPGGGIEEGETPEEATIREALEELGVKVEVKECIAEIEFNGVEYYILGNIIGGTICSGIGEEYTNPIRDRGTYEPMWVEIGSLSKKDVRPKGIAEKLPLLIS
jgi:8-oxo-dGTP diphosphatase